MSAPTLSARAGGESVVGRITASLDARPRVPYSAAVVYTEAIGRENPCNVGGQPPRAAFFMSVTPSHAFDHGGPGGAAFGLAGAYVPVSHPRCQARHPSRENERRASTSNVGGQTVRHTPARPEQKQFPLSIAAGRAAAVLWLENPVMSAATWRDNRFAAHACGMGFPELVERRHAFNEAFAQGIAEAIVGVVLIAVEVCHA